MINITFPDGAVREFVIWRYQLLKLHNLSATLWLKRHLLVNLTAN